MSSLFPLVSVIIPVYNHESYVVQALLSIWEQTYPSIEMIIIDDGSRDNSCTVIEQLINQWQSTNTSGRKITFIKQANQGAHATINRGLALASGDFLTILNSDDYYSPKRIANIVFQLQQQKAEWAFTGVQGIDQKGNPLPIDHYWKVWYEQNVFTSCLHVTIGFQLLQDNLTVSTGNLFFSRWIYEKVGEFKNLKLAHDYDYALRALLFSEPLFIQEKLYFYRMHNTNTLHQVNHLVDIEKMMIYHDYLLKISEKAPENKVAPCHWYWPILFPKFRSDRYLDRGFLSDLISTTPHQPSPSKKSTVSLPLTPDPKSKKITLITHSLCLSGAPKVVLDLAILLKQQGHEINVISLAEGPLRKEFEALGISVNSIPHQLGFWFAAPNKIRKIQKMLQLLYAIFFKTERIVISNSAVSWPILFPLVFFSPFRKFYWYVHESFSPSSMIEPGAGTNLFRRIKNKARLKGWFGCESTRQIWKEDLGGVVKYWSGIPQQPWQPTPKKRIKNILSIGTVTPRKATLILLDAFIECVEKKYLPEDVTLTIIGFTDSLKDPYLCELLIKLNISGLKNRINFIKNLEATELQPFYEKADLYIQSSVVEGLPLALLQAMSMGLPIITTNVNGCAEAIQHHETGYVCVSRSSHALANAISEAVNHPERSSLLGLKAQQKFNEIFCLEKTQNEILCEF